MSSAEPQRELPQTQTELPLPDAASRVRVCEEFSREPIFPFRPNGQPIIFHGKDPGGDYELELGAIDKLSPHDRGPKRCPSLGIDHAVLLLAHFEVYKVRPLGSDASSPSFRKLWRAFSGSPHPPSLNQRRAFKRLMDDLDVCRMRVTRPGADPVVYNLMESEVQHVRRPGRRGLMASRYANFRFHPVFLRTVLYAPLTRDVNLAVLRAMASRYSRTLYLWLPSRAARNPASKPFIISSEKLWEQMGLPGSTLKQRSDVLKKTPVLRELDGAPLLDGRRMRLAVVRGADDIFLQVWSEGPEERGASKRFNLTGPLATAFQKSGRTEAEYIHCIRTRQPLNEDEMDLLQRGGIENVEGSIAFFEISRAAVGPTVFRELLAEAKGFRLEGGQATGSFGARLRTALLNRIGLPVPKKAE